MSKRFKWYLRKLFSSCRSNCKDTLPSQRRLLRLPNDAFSPLPQQPQRCRRARKNKLLLSTRSRVGEDNDKFGLMEIEMERSFDSSTDFSPHRETIRKCPSLGHRRNKQKQPTTSDPARLSAVLQSLAVEVEGKVRESFAVVKSSDDPYDDFRRSMAEMIVEKEMVEEADLRELLRCFLSLNSDHHHAVIIAAFNHIYNAFFSNNPDDPSLLRLPAPV